MHRIAFVAVSLVVLSVGSVLGVEGAGFEDISLKDLKAALDAKGVTVIDCNGVESFTQGHIPGAIDLQGIKGDLSAKLPQDKAGLIVAYCGSEKCPAWKAGAEAAKALGYTNVKHFAPGIKGWRGAGEAVETVQSTPKAKECGCGGM
jgi:rhodanese-related sulfurtransferase